MYGCIRKIAGGHNPLDLPEQLSHKAMAMLAWHQYSEIDISPTVDRAQLTVLIVRRGRREL